MPERLEIETAERRRRRGRGEEAEGASGQSVEGLRRGKGAPADGAGRGAGRQAASVLWRMQPGLSVCARGLLQANSDSAEEK